MSHTVWSWRWHELQEARRVAHAGILDGFHILEGQGPSLQLSGEGLDFLWELEWSQGDDGQSLARRVVC